MAGTTSGLCVTGIGEILMDRFDTGAVTLGGAPFNVTFHLHQLLTAFGVGEAVFVSRVGNDVPGIEILGQVTGSGMTPAYVAVDETHATGSAMVYVQQGDAGFEILPDVAWDYIPDSPALADLAGRSSAVVFGSLAQRSDVSCHTIQRFVAKVAGPRLYDVNLRRNTTDGMAGYSKEIIEQSLGLATIVKMNDAEIEEISGLLGLHAGAITLELRTWELMELMLHKFGLTAVAVTRGAKGALVMDARQRLQLPDSAIAADKVHPVGAGDSFAAGLLCGLVQGWSLDYALKLAETMSSWVVLHETATPRLTPEMLHRVQALALEAGR